MVFKQTRVFFTHQKIGNQSVIGLFRNKVARAGDFIRVSLKKPGSRLGIGYVNYTKEVRVNSIAFSIMKLRNDWIPLKRRFKYPTTRRFFFCSARVKDRRVFELFQTHICMFNKLSVNFTSKLCATIVIICVVFSQINNPVQLNQKFEVIIFYSTVLSIITAIFLFREVSVFKT